MIKNVNNHTCWIVGEGLTGTENQCIGVAEAMNIVPVVKRIRLREPWRTFSPYLRFEQWWSFAPLLQPPWPDIVIAAGRKGIAPARFIRRASNGKTFCAFLQDPKCDPSDFNLVAAPAHDGLNGDNVITTIAAPNRITDQRLADALKEFPALQRTANQTRTNIAVLIGGNSKTHKMKQAEMMKTIEKLKKLDARLMITTSRRTPPQIVSALRAAFDGGEHVIWTSEKDGPNPYFAFLAAADYIIATNDSASMLSEAASTGKPLYSIALSGGSTKFEKLYKNLENCGAMRPFAGKLEKWEYEPLNDTQKVANTILSALKNQINIRKDIS